MAPSPTAAAAASAAGGGGRVCAVITITATANANGESLPPSRTHSLTPGPLCVTPRFQFRLLHFQILPISRLNEGILTQPYGSIIRCIGFSTARNTRRSGNATSAGRTKSDAPSASITTRVRRACARLSVHQISKFESSAHVERAHTNHIKSTSFNSSVFCVTAIQVHASNLQVDPRAMAQSPILWDAVKAKIVYRSISSKRRRRC